MILKRLLLGAALAAGLLAGCTTLPQPLDKNARARQESEIAALYRQTHPGDADTGITLVADGKPVRGDGTLTYRYFVDEYASASPEAEPIATRIAVVTLRDDAPTTTTFPEVDPALLEERLSELKQAVAQRREARRQKELRDQREREELNAIPSTGPGKLAGHAFGKTIGGTTKSAAGARVILIPDCALGRRLADTLVNNRNATADRERAAFGGRLREVTADPDGRFLAENLPEHPYLAVAHLSWGYLIPGETYTTTTTETSPAPGFGNRQARSDKNDKKAPPPPPPTVTTTTSSTRQSPDQVLITHQPLKGQATPTRDGAPMTVGPANPFPSGTSARSPDEAY